MRSKRVITLNEARERTPQVSAVEAMRKQLQLALYDAVKESDVVGMVEKLKAMALEGDLKAMALFFKLVVGGDSQPRQVQQVAVFQPEPEVPQPASPTPALPRTPERLEVYAERLSNGTSLHHAGDRNTPGEE